MSKFYIHSVEQALDIIKVWERCGSCDSCPLCTPEGWRCSYIHDCALNYLKQHDVKTDKKK